MEIEEDILLLDFLDFFRFLVSIRPVLLFVMRRVLLAGLCSVLLLTACGGHVPLPVGEQTVQGTLERVGISLTRRGTHLLRVDEHTAYYVESTTVRLLPYEGRIVRLKGTFEPNVYVRDLPVLVVTEIVGDDREALRTWMLPAFGVAVDLPRSWSGNVSSSVAQFTVSGSELPVLRVAREAQENLPFDFTSMATSGSSLALMPLELNGRRAVMIRYVEEPLIIFTVAEKGAQQETADVLAFSFRLPDDSPAARDRVLMLMRTLRDAVATSAPADTPPPRPNTGTGASAVGKPCGGPAGVLCPAGYFCQVTDTATDIGVCTRM